MVRAEPSLFDFMDGWTSHSYPNPAFSGSPHAAGRGTLRSYLWELAHLRSLGLSKSLPVFITETGWVHSEGVRSNPGLMSPDRAAENFRIAAQSVWQDPAIIAVTPFVYSYQGLPFDHFSWKRLGSNNFYPQYDVYRQIEKTTGSPKQREKYTTEKRLVPESLVAGSTYTIRTLVRNEGQGIYSEQNGYTVELVTNPKFTVVRDPLPVMEPGQYGTLTMHVETPNLTGEYQYDVDVVRGNTRTTIETGKSVIVPPPAIDIQVQLGFRKENTAINATVLVYDNNTVIHKVPGVAIRNGKARIEGLRNVLPGSKYRVVVLIPYYLPRQSITVLKADKTAVKLPKFLAVDFNNDGTFSPRDFIALLSLPPNFITSLWFRR